MIRSIAFGRSRRQLGFATPPEDYQIENPGTVEDAISSARCASRATSWPRTAISRRSRAAICWRRSAPARTAWRWRSNYNGRPRAAEVLVDGGEHHLIRRRETYRGFDSAGSGFLASVRLRLSGAADRLASCATPQAANYGRRWLSMYNMRSVVRFRYPFSPGCSLCRAKPCTARTRRKTRTRPKPSTGSRREELLARRPRRNTASSSTRPDKTEQKTLSYWSAIKFETGPRQIRSRGPPSQAHARQGSPILKSRMDPIKVDPSEVVDKDLVKLEEAEGLSAFLPPGAREAEWSELSAV